jgi:Type I phosphodiesterase / nucleotide pyrophosphatase
MLRRMTLLAALASAGLLAPAQAAPVDESEHDGRHVLLISVDGLHASDLSQWVSKHPNSALAKLSSVGTTYTHASASEPSDSFPGLLAQVTGGSPKTTGVFYDDAYARNMWAPGSNCAGSPGTETLYAENLDKTVNGDIPLFTSIDPANLPLAMINGKCTGVYPHQFLETNTIFNVARQAGLYTAWSDKHPAYEIVNGPSGLGVNDLYTPEINNAHDPTAISVTATNAYDQLKVTAILNEIDGKTSDGSKTAPVPAIFGMNFQSVSVGEKLVDPVKSCKRNQTNTCDPNYFPGGYQPVTLEFTPQMTQAMQFVDGAIGSMADELRKRELLDKTEIIVSAKHGQSPIDPAKLSKIGDAVSPILSKAGIDIGQNTTDDISLVWLKDQSQTAAAVAALQADKNGANTARIQYVLSGAALAEKFGDPLHNSRTPDLIVQPIPGTIYTNSKAKVAEHGGFAEDDTHVAMLVVNGGSDEREREQPATVGAPVQTKQIAPTILAFLGLDPEALQAVRQEGTQPLPRER